MSSWTPQLANFPTLGYHHLAVQLQKFLLPGNYRNYVQQLLCDRVPYKRIYQYVKSENDLSDFTWHLHTTTVMQNASLYFNLTQFYEPSASIVTIIITVVLHLTWQLCSKAHKQKLFMWPKLLLGMLSFKGSAQRLFTQVLGFIAVCSTHTW